MSHSILELCSKFKCPNHQPYTSGTTSSSNPQPSPASTLNSSSSPPLPTCSLTNLISHPVTTFLVFLAAFTLLIYGLYLLTPNLRRPKQKPLRSTPLMEYHRTFERLVEDLKRLVELGRHEEVIREYERSERTKNGGGERFGTVDHVREILEELRSASAVTRVEGGLKEQSGVVRQMIQSDLNFPTLMTERLGLSRRARTY